MMRKQIAIAAFIVGATSGTAHAYDIGHLTCQNVGQLAAHMLIARKSGVPPQDYLSALNNQLPADATTERELALEIAKVVYENDQIANLQPEQAYAVFTKNCMDGQEQDRMSGQREDGGDDQEDNESADGEQRI